MEIEIHNTWNPKAIEKFKLGERLREAFKRVDDVLNHIEELKPSLRNQFAEALVKRLDDAIGEFLIHTAMLGPHLLEDYELLQEYPTIQHSVYQFTLMMLNLPLDRHPADEEIEVFSLDNARAHERLPYYMVKACIDVLDREKGISLWRNIVGLRLRDERMEYEKKIKEKLDKGEPLATMKDTNDGAMERWNRIGLGNYVIARLDENMTLFRFDKCHTHEALKDLNDPDIAYLCSCYIGDHPDYNFGRKFLRRTQTLHHGDFCDELYWMTDVHDNPEQPSLEFTKNLGKE